MYVRNDDFHGVTYIDKKMDEKLKQNSAIKTIVSGNITFTIVDIPIAYEIMLKDIREKGEIIYPKTLNV